VNSRVRALDHGRGVAALVVVFYHATTTINMGDWPSDSSLKKISEFLFFPSKFGEASVFFFMALSGFVLSRVVQKSDKAYMTHWLIWRAIRLVPLYLVSLIAAFALLTPDITELDSLTLYLTPYFLFSNETVYSGPNPVLWSLMIEIVLSSIFLLLYKLKIHQWKYSFVIYTFIYLLTYFVPTWGGRAFVRCLIFFLIGISLARLQKEVRLWKNTMKFLVLLCIFVAGISPSWGRQFITFSQIFVIPLLVHYLANIHNPQPRATRILDHLGKISFTLYAFHWPILMFVKSNLLIPANPFLNSKLVLVPVVCISAIGVCSVLYQLIEKPSIKLSRAYLNWASKN
jgi:peptidoglycan/LPS O-acetylase OafA/YrhL